MKNMKYIWCAVYFVLAIVSFIVGYFVFFSNRYLHNATTKPADVIFGFIPSVLLLIMSVLILCLYNKEKSRHTFKICTILMPVILVVYFISAFIVCGLIEAYIPDTNIKSYNYVVNETIDILPEAFPAKIPDSAEKVKFMYSPSMSKDVTNIYLYYVDREMTTKKFNDIYAKKAKWIGNINGHIVEVITEDKTSTTKYDELASFAFSDTPAKGINENDYTIYLIEKSITKLPSHGKILFAAFNEKTKETICQYFRW